MMLSNVGNSNSEKQLLSSKKSDFKDDKFINELSDMIELSVKSSNLPDNALINSEGKKEKSDKETLNFLPLGNGQMIDLSSIEKLKAVASKLKMANNNSQQDNISKNIVFNLNIDNNLFEEVDLDQIKKQVQLLDKYGSVDSKVNLENHPKIKLIRETTKDLIQQHREFLAPFKAKLGLTEEATPELISEQNLDIQSKIKEVKESNKNFFSKLKEQLNGKLQYSNTNNNNVINLNIDSDLKPGIIATDNKNAIDKDLITNKKADLKSELIADVKNDLKSEFQTNIKSDFKLESKLLNNQSVVLKNNNITNKELVELVSKYSEDNKDLSLNKEPNSKFNNHLLQNNNKLSLVSEVNNEISSIINKYNSKETKYSEKDIKTNTLIENKDENGIKLEMDNNNKSSGDYSAKDEKLFNGKKLLDLFVNGKISSDSLNKNLTEFKQVSNDIKASAKEYIIYRDIQAKNIATTTANSVNNLAPNGSAVIKMNLNPANLGNIFVEVNVINNVATLNFKSESKETLKLIEHQINNLVDKLNNQGITADTITVSSNQDDSQDLQNKGKFFDKENKEQKDRKEYFENLKNLALLNEIKS